MAAVRILLVSYWYPPAVGAAAERIGSFARFLPEHGWDVTVLTAARGCAPPEQAGVKVAAVRDRLAGGEPAFADYDPRRRASGWKSALRGWLLFPDRFAVWARAAAKTGVKILRRERFDVVLASFPPASSAVVGLRLHEASGVPLVVDYRDLWIGPGGYEPRSGRALAAHRELERAVVRAAIALVAVSEPMANALAEEHGFDRVRIFVIPNGYEPTPAADSGFRNSQFAIRNSLVIAHVGTVIARNQPDLFFESLRRVKDDPRLSSIEFRFVGNLSRDYAESLGLGGRVTTTGLVDREQARREMETADGLLLLTGAYVARWGHNAKLFEYVQTGRPILCLEEEQGSNDRKLLERFTPDRAFFAPTSDAAAIAAAIERLRAYLVARPNPAVELDAAFREYSRANLAGRLAAELSSL